MLCFQSSQEQNNFCVNNFGKCTNTKVTGNDYALPLGLCPCHHTGSSRRHVSVLLPGESSVQWKRIGSDIWQFDKVDLVS